MSTKVPREIQEDVQGDVIFGFTKKFQIFLFFLIRHPTVFKQRFAQHLRDRITTTGEVIHQKKECQSHKKHGEDGLLPIRGLNVSFSSAGLKRLGITELLDFVDGDVTKPGPFSRGQLSDAQSLGDQGRFTPAGFDPAWRAEFKKPVHGVFLITGESYEAVSKTADEIGQIFSIHNGIDAAIVEVLRFKGQVRPDSQAKHEHFGYADGISQPALIGIHPRPPAGAPPAINSGVILLGQENDPDQDKRPTWAKNGSFLVFRDLLQLVPEFDEFIRNEVTKPDGRGSQPFAVEGLSEQQNIELLGARMVGRWKTGRPIQLSPRTDDGGNANENAFNFAVGPDEAPQNRCPFHAHIRKTLPRTDLPDPVLEQFRIMRHGIPYGPEVTEEEKAEKKSLFDRGLAFVSYQSQIDNGFAFIQRSWVDNPDFPPKGDHRTGLDPIIGQTGADPSIFHVDPKDDDREAFGHVPGRETSRLTMPAEFVISRGGEYFFTPPISALSTDRFSLPLDVTDDYVVSGQTVMI